MNKHFISTAAVLTLVGITCTATIALTAHPQEQDGVDIRLTKSKDRPLVENGGRESYGGLPLRAQDTKVVVLPVINGSGEKDQRQRYDQAVKGDQELQKVFSERGFDVIAGQAVHRMLIDNEIDLTNEEYWNRATLYKVGKKLGAHLVVFVVIDNVEQVRQFTPITKDQELVGKVRCRTWVIDAVNERAIIASKKTEASSKNFIYAEVDSGARLIRNTVPKAVKSGVEEFVNGYRKSK
jgi:hypothetical protein